MSDPQSPLSEGTQVVVSIAAQASNGKLVHPAGAIAIITQAPLDATHTYRVRYADGMEIPVKRSQIKPTADYKQATFEGGQDSLLGQFDLNRYVIYRCVVGSRAFGLSSEQSDTDRRGIYLPPAELHWSLYGVPEQLENKDADEVYWELQKFLVLALKANPNVLECLYTPLIESCTPIAQELLDIRSAFLSKLVYQTFSGYVVSQFRKLAGDLRNKGAIKWKHAMHLIRLLLSGIHLLRDQVLMIDVGEYREQLLAIKSGQMQWEEVDRWRAEMQQQFETAYEQTTLPERPDYEKVNAFLIRARRSMVNAG